MLKRVQHDGRGQVSRCLFLPSEVHAYNVGAVFDDDIGAIIAGFFKRFGFAFTRIDMELQREIYGWVNKAGDRGVGDEEMRRDLAERQANFKMFGLHLQVPIFVLEHDGHLVGEALDEMTREYLQTELTRITAETGAAVVFVTHSIAEAVYLSTRIVVMSPRPGRIVKVIDSPLPAERTLALRDTPAFMALAHEVREALADGHH